MTGTNHDDVELHRQFTYRYRNSRKYARADRPARAGR
jgi:hypothetical protein